MALKYHDAITLLKHKKYAPNIATDIQNGAHTYMPHNQQQQQQPQHK